MLDRSAVTDELRARVRAELPEVAEIRDPELRAKVIEVWALALATSSFGAIAEIEPSGNPGVNTLQRGTQTDHIRGVTRLAMRIAEEMSALMPELKVDRDIVIAGALCHDVGKPWEFDPENRRRWEADPRAAGLPSVRHPVYGVHLCFTVGLPEAGGASRGGALGRGRAPGALAREHDRAPRRLCVLGGVPRRRSSDSRERRRVEAPALSRI